MPEVPLNDVTAAVKTFLRDKSLLHCVRTLKEQYPDMPIIVADDGRCTDDKEAKLREAGVVKYVRMPWNSGLPAGRNALLDACETPYILMCEDDFSFTPDSHVERLRRLMDVTDIAAGLVYNVRRWACHEGGVGWDPFGGKFVRSGEKVFRTGFTGSLKHYDGIGYEEADFVLNFFVGRADALRKVRWDADLRLAFEHLDFFLRAKEAGLRTARSPDAQVLHKEVDDVRNPEYQKFRDDYERYRAPFKTKWGFDWVADLPRSLPSPPITVPPPLPASAPEHAAGTPAPTGYMYTPDPAHPAPPSLYPGPDDVGCQLHGAPRCPVCR